MTKLTLLAALVLGSYALPALADTKVENKTETTTEVSADGKKAKHTRKTKHTNADGTTTSTEKTEKVKVE